MSSITKQLGPIAQVYVKLALPLAFVEYINEVAIRKNRELRPWTNIVARRRYE